MPTTPISANTTMPASERLMTNTGRSPILGISTHFGTAAQLTAKRNVGILHKLMQPVDRPINIFHPEGSYLKGLVLFVE